MAKIKVLLYCYYQDISQRKNNMNNNQIHFRVEFTIEEGKTEEYKKIVKELIRTVESSEPNTINYNFYLNRSETICIVNETYINSEAAFAHITGAALQTILPKILNVSRISQFDLYGNPSEELQNALICFSPQTYNLIAGFSRDMPESIDLDV